MAMRTPFLLLILFGGQAAWAGGGCPRSILTDDDRANLATLVMHHTKIAVNLATASCEDRNWVWLETFRAPQKSGTERWFRLSCSRMEKSSPEPWHCIEYPLYGFRVDTYPGELGIWVSIDERAKLDGVRRDVTQALALLAGTGQVPLCGTQGDLKTIEGLRAYFTQGDGIVSLTSTKTSFFLEHDLVSLQFDRPADADPMPRVACWSPVEVVVTG